MNGYELLAGFEHVYLEDSWVLRITREANTLAFDVDLVLLDSHERFTPPRPSETHCYQRVRIVFDSLRSLTWTAGHARAAVDATGETDLGSFDSFRFEEDRYEIEGDFGVIAVEAAAPTINWGNSTSLTFASEARLSLNRAMWDAVLPSLRGVALRAVYPKIEARFIYESVGEPERIVTDDIETLVVADFYEDVEVVCTPVEVPSEAVRELHDGEWWVFLRYEEASAGPIE